MTARKTFCLLNIIVLLFITTYAHAEENAIDYDYGELLVLVNSYDLSVDEKQNQYNDEVQKKINFLKERGYSQVKDSPSFYDEEIYRIIYGSSFGRSEGCKSSNFSKDGINYRLIFAQYKPNDPNFYVSVTFEVGGERYWFLKINYFLEYFRVEEWLNTKTGVISVEKIFY